MTYFILSHFEHAGILSCDADLPFQVFPYPAVICQEIQEIQEILGHNLPFQGH